MTDNASGGCPHKYHQQPDGSFLCSMCGASYRMDQQFSELDLTNSPGAIAERKRVRSDRRTRTVLDMLMDTFVFWRWGGWFRR
ncbi:MAG: hypothetical protein KKF41_02505 [Actinobacteria bacterium]|nr:hypothetical protein [Actinomycetota bacterium]MBU1945109.1 hypothetical protein [Actinomycetota bacterium]MBU2686440.1 hypothetical protein [Actinomycetota bacterium]